MMKTALYCSPGNHLRQMLRGALLAAAAQHKDLDRQHHYYFTRMLEICQTCRGKYATDKFPGFGGAAPVTHTH